jgi:uridine phosphorylase
MKRDVFSQDPVSIVDPEAMVRAFVSEKDVTLETLLLDPLALLVFRSQDLRSILEKETGIFPDEAWRCMNRRIYRGKGWNLALSPWGAPSAVMFLEELAAFGVKKALYWGYGGSLQEDIGIGHMILPLEAIREEGTSYHYLREHAKSTPDPVLQRQFAAALQGVPVSSHEGTVWTTDAPYRETPEKIRRYRAQNVLAVDMELSALYALGRAKGIAVGAVLIASDRVRETGWEPGFHSQKLCETRAQMAGTLVRCLEKMR